MQRSIGKKIFAVVAGVGLATAGLTVAAPVANAEESKTTCGIGKDNTIVKAQAAAATQCQETLFTLFDMGADPNTVKMDGQPQAPYQEDESWVVVWMMTVGIDPNPPAPEPDVDVDEDIEEIVTKVVQTPPPPPPCWDPSINNCPVGGALLTDVPQYMIAGVPQQLIVYAAWRPDASASGAPTNGDAVISMDGEPVAAAPFVDGVATFSFTPTEPGLKEVVVSGVLNSNTGGGNAWIDSVEGATMVMPYDPALLEEALKNKKVEVGDTYTLEEVAQAKTALGKRLEWRVAQDSSGVCAVTTTKKGEVKAKFTESGKCSIIWTDPKTDEEGKYTFKVTE